MTRSLNAIAAEIYRDWRNVYFGAVPYLRAMRELDSINDQYGSDSAKEIVRRFLVNASSWRGPIARSVKAELKEMLGDKAKRSAPGVRDGVIVDASYWLWVDEQRKLAQINNEWTDYRE